jgi:hypothetical protein
MKYRNKTALEQVIPNVGVVKAGAIIETTIPINNPNFELISEPVQEKKIEPHKNET